MEINDYSKRLAQARSNFNESREEIRQQYNDNLEDVKSRNEQQRKNQESNFVKAKTDLEGKLDKYVGEYSEKTRDAIQDQTDNYRRSLDGEKFEFNKERTRLKNDFDRRLNDLKVTYKNRDQDRDEYTKHTIDNIENNYSRQKNDLNNQFENDLRNSQHNAEIKFAKYTNDQNVEKRNLINSFESDMRDRVKSDLAVKAKMADQAQDDMRKLRESQTEQISHLKDHQKEAIAEIKKNQGNETELVQENFRNLTNDLSRRAVRKRRQEVKENQVRNEQLQKEYAKNLYQANRQMQEKLKGGTTENKADKKLAHTVNTYEERIKNIYDKIDDTNFTQQLDKERMAESFIEANKSLKRKHSRSLDEQLTSLRNDRTLELAELKKETASQINSYKNELVKSDLRAEAQAIKDRTYSKKALDNQRLAFGETVKVLNDRNQEAVSKLQEVHAKEKTDFITKTRADHHKELEELKFDLKSTMVAKENSLQERNSQLKKLNEKMAVQYEEKYARLQKKTAKEIERIKDIFAQQSEQQRMEMRESLSAKERDNEHEKIVIRQGYDKRLSRAKDMADRQIEKIVEYYEDALTRQRDESKKKLTTKVFEMRSDYEKLYQSAELEKATMERQFSDRIEELRQANQKALHEEAKERRSAFS